MPPPYCYDYPRPMVTVDTVVFSSGPQGVRVLLIRRKHAPFARTWAIPGGYLEMDEPVEAGARRELKEETGLEIPGPIEPIGFFGDPGRDPRGRTITLAHAAVVRAGEYAVEGRDDAAEAAWITADDADLLAFDHAEILARARNWLREGVERRDLALRMLPRQFTLREARNLFQAVGFSSGKARYELQKLTRQGKIASLPEHRYEIIERPARSRRGTRG